MPEDAKSLEHAVHVLFANNALENHVNAFAYLRVVLSDK